MAHISFYCTSPPPQKKKKKTTTYSALALRGFGAASVVVKERSWFLSDLFATVPSLALHVVLLNNQREFGVWSLRQAAPVTSLHPPFNLGGRKNS